MTQLGVVIIGRNEGERLVRCLGSIGSDVETVYVDSGSSDGSVEEARASNARVIELNMSLPFTAARARNAGRAALSRNCGLIQFVDGDCMLQPGWLAAASQSLSNDMHLAAVFGRRREISPDSSLYNWLCDVEWSVPPGPARYFGGDVMICASALDLAGGYSDEMIAGEEPDLAIRLRARGLGIACLPAEMTLHDAAITRFGQWWRRTMRSGHAYAELAARHRNEGGADYRKRLRSVLFWGAAVPLAALLMGSVGLLAGRRWWIAGAGLLLGLPLLQLSRLVARNLQDRGLIGALTIAMFLMLAKPVQAFGISTYWFNRLTRQRSTIIEYKVGES